MLTFPKAPTANDLRVLRHAAEKPGRIVTASIADRRERNRLIAAGLVDGDSWKLTPAGISTAGRQTGLWTVAWRVNRPGHRIVRAQNWTGTWAEARELAGLLVELAGKDELQVWYVGSAHAERTGYVHEEDRGNLLLDGGRRVKLWDTGWLPAELLDGEVNSVANALYVAHTQYMRAQAGGAQRYTLAQCFAQAVEIRQTWAPASWASLVRQAGTAEERKEESYYRQTWVREKPEGWDAREAERAEIDARLARLGSEGAEELLADTFYSNDRTDRRLGGALGQRDA